MKKQPVKEIKNSINCLTHQIRRLRKSIDSNLAANKAYNRLIIERAKSRKKLKEVQANNVISFLVKKLGKKNKEKLISDYFKDSGKNH